ncbi:MAG: GTP-binding protein [Planctomycetes bacterium]|nr:GTP-binding protein [Planctomycetota bacterium]
MDRLRTFGIVAHIDAGKTTLTERILFDSGSQGWIGNVDDGTATMDWLPAERARGISITAAATRVQWGDHLLQVVDTPGHVDFVAEVERCLHVLDGVVVLVDGVRGVESQTEAVWQQSAARGLPRLVFVNKLDREGADFAAVVDELAERLDCRPVPFVVPLYDEARVFAGLGDALTGKVQWFDGRPGPDAIARLQREVESACERVAEVAADFDDAILADVLAGRRVAAERLRAALRGPVLAGRVCPVLAGAALWNRGVDWLLDAVCAWLPALSELPRKGLWSVDRAGEADAPLAALVFKVQHADEVWNFLRVVRGRLRPGTAWTRARPPFVPQTANALWQMRADRHEDLATAEPGAMVVLPGELGLRTGDTVCDPSHPVHLAAPRFPTPVLAVAFEPQQAADAPALAKALRELAVDDPTLRVDRERDRILVHGMGELHLDVTADVVRARTGLAFTCGRPVVDRREAVRQAGCGDAEVRAMVAGVERSARAVVAVMPGDEGPARVQAAGGGAAASVAEELSSRASAGLRVGPLVDCQVTVEQAVGDAHGCLEPLLLQAATLAFEQAMQNAGWHELEPWVRIEIWCPQESSPPVLADLKARGVEVLGVWAGRLGARLEAKGPLSRMLGYVTKLRSMTKGRGQASMRPLGYAPPPSSPQ